MSLHLNIQSTSELFQSTSIDEPSPSVSSSVSRDPAKWVISNTTFDSILLREIDQNITEMTLWRLGYFTQK